MSAEPVLVVNSMQNSWLHSIEFQMNEDTNRRLCRSHAVRKNELNKSLKLEDHRCKPKANKPYNGQQRYPTANALITQIIWSSKMIVKYNYLSIAKYQDLSEGIKIRWH